MKQLLLFAVLCAPCVALASTVTATITDTDGQTWNNGTWSVTLTIPGGPSNLDIPKVNGVPVSPLTFTGTLSSSGVLSVTLTDTSSVDQPDARQVFTICPNTSGQQCQTISTAVIGETPDITSLFSQIKAPRFPAGAEQWGYSDGEVQLPPPSGSTYFNVTDNCLHQWNGVVWSACSGVDASGNVNMAPQGINYAQTQAGTQAIASPCTTSINCVSPIAQGTANTDLFQTGGGNNGIAKLTSSSFCGSGCTGVQPPTSISTETTPLVAQVFQGSGVAGMNWAGGTAIIDQTHGQQTELSKDPLTATYLGGVTYPYAARRIGAVQFSDCNPNSATGSSLVFPNCAYDQYQFDAMGGGYNEFIPGITPSFKTNFQAFPRTIGMFTAGQLGSGGVSVNCAGFGDCLMGTGGVAATISGGYGDNADEGPHVSSYQINEASQAMLFKCTAGCGTGVSSFTFSPVPGEQGFGMGDERYIQDVQSPTTSQSLGIHITAGNEQAVPLANFVMSGALPTDAWLGLSTTPEYTAFAKPVGQVGTVTVTIQTMPAWSSATTYSKNSAVTSNDVQYISKIDTNLNNTPISSPNQWSPMAGLQASTTSLGASGIACVADAGQGAGPDYYETVPWTKTGTTTFTMTFQKPHPAIVIIGIGGLCQNQIYPNAHLYGSLSAGAVGQANTILGNFGSTLYIADYAGTNAIAVGSNTSESEIAYYTAGSTSVVRDSSNVTTFAADLSWLMNGHTITISGCSDTSFNAASVIPTATGPNTFSYPNTGSATSTTGCTVVDDNAEFTIVPAIKVRRILNPATKSIDGTIGSLYPNSVAINTTDQLLSPHFAKMAIAGPGHTNFINQTIPRPDYFGLNSAGMEGLTIEGRAGPAAFPSFVLNNTPVSIYSSYGGYKNPPLTARGSAGPFQWNSNDVNVGSGGGAGGGWAFVGCKMAPIGCNSWNSAYNLFELQGQNGNTFLQHNPNTNTLTLSASGGQTTSLNVQNFTASGSASLPNLFFPNGAAFSPSLTLPAPYNVCCGGNQTAYKNAAGAITSTFGLASVYNGNAMLIGPCNVNNGNDTNCAPGTGYDLILSAIKAKYLSTLNGADIGLGLPSITPVVTAAHTGGTFYSYSLYAKSALGSITPIGQSGGSLSATISGMNTVTVQCPSSLQGGYDAGVTYGVERDDSIDLGPCPVGTNVVDDGTAKTLWVDPAHNATAALNAETVTAKQFIGSFATGSASNSDVAGVLTLIAGTQSYTFAKTYTSTPVCTASDTTAIAAVQTVVTTTTLTINGIGTDVINYICIGRN